MEEKSKTLLVQEKIKQLIQSKKRIVKNETVLDTKRLKSHFEGQPLKFEEGQQYAKPKSSIRMRPQTAARNKESSSNTVTTDQSNKDIDINVLIDEVFKKGFELSKFIQKNNLKEEDCKKKIAENELFNMLILSKLTKIEEQRHQTVTQQLIISKLKKIKMIELQQKNCLFLQNKICSLIDQRLTALLKY